MNDQRRPPRRPQSNRSLKAYTGSDVIRHLNIDHLLWVNDRWYRRRMKVHFAVLSNTFRVVRVHFLCRESCCVEMSPQRTTKLLLDGWDDVWDLAA